MFSRPNRKSHNKKPRIRKSKTPRASRKTPADNSSPDIRYGTAFRLRNARPAPVIIPPRCAEPPPTKHIPRNASGKVHPAKYIRRPSYAGPDGPCDPSRTSRPAAPIIAPLMRRTASYEAHPAKHIRQSTSGDRHTPAPRSVRPQPNFAARRPGHRPSMRRTAAAAPAKSVGRSQWTVRRFSTTIRPSTTTVSTSAALPQ